MKFLQWRHNEHNGVSNHQPRDCLFNRLFRHRSKRISKLRVVGLCAGNSPVTCEFPELMASNAENSFHLMTSSCRTFSWWPSVTAFLWLIPCRYSFEVIVIHLKIRHILICPFTYYDVFHIVKLSNDFCIRFTACRWFVDHVAPVFVNKCFELSICCQLDSLVLTTV